MVNDDELQSIQGYIYANELDWWIHKLARPAVRKLINDNTSANIKAKDFSGFLGEHCQIYSVWKRKPLSTQKVLTGEQWERLKYCVVSLQDFILRVGIEKAVEIVRSKVSTNKILLKGLPKRLHYWE